MESVFVQVACDIRIDWHSKLPRYRTFVNDELFTERVVNLNTNQYIEEIFQIQANPGTYNLKVELLTPNTATLQANNYRVLQGNAKVDNNVLTIIGA